MGLRKGIFYSLLDIIIITILIETWHRNRAKREREKKIQDKLICITPYLYSEAITTLLILIARRRQGVESSVESSFGGRATWVVASS